MRRKILIIDDEPVTREVLKSILERADYDVVLAEDGLSGIETARCENPDLVITDGLLPKMHGFLVCKAIKEFASPPKVIVLTGLYTKPTYRWSVKHDYGADDLLVKPITPADLLACVEKHLAGLAHLDLPETLPVPLSTEGPGTNWQVVRQQSNAEPQFESRGASFSHVEMEEIFREWSVPCF
jgi:DNA-binding response OmpR family regulator